MMNHYLIAAANLAVLGLVACAGSNVQPKSDTAEQYLVGAYADCRSLDDAERQLFESVYSHRASLTPQSVATQVVAGTNYRFICTDSSENVVEVVIFKPLHNQGEPRISSIRPATEYDGIIASVRAGMDDGWQSTTPEDLGVSYIYQYRSPSMGYALNDINGDGIQELLLGDAMPDSYAIYDIFTYDAEEGRVKHTFCGGERDHCTINGEGTIMREGSNSASDSFTKYYRLNGGELVELQEAAAHEDSQIIRFASFLKP